MLMSTLYNSRIARRTSPLPTSETHRMGDVVISSATYTYDGKGNVIGDGTTTYEYDALNRLVKETKGTAVSNYSYDGNGRISNFAGKACTYDNRGRLTKIGSTTLTYDNYGNRLSKGSTNYTWTRGRLLSCVGSNTFEYDYSGIRSKKNDIEYYYNGNKLLAEKRGNDMIYYFYDDSGVSGFWYNNNYCDFVKNIFGDVIKIYRGASCVAEYSYDAWGNCTIVSQAYGIGDLNPIRYRGYYYDTETKLYYLQNRYYDPEVGQFISPDTFDYLQPETIGGVDLYAYCLNNPVTYSDPSGHFVITTIIGTILIGALIGGAIGGAFELGRQIIFEGGVNNWSKIGLAVLGGAAAGAITAIPLPGKGFLSYLGTFALGGFGSVVSGFITGTVGFDNGWSIALAFGIGGIANVVARGVSDIILGKKALAIFNQGKKAKSLAVQQLQGNARNMGSLALKGSMRNAFKDTSLATIKILLMNAKPIFRLGVYSSLNSAALSSFPYIFM